MGGGDLRLPMRFIPGSSHRRYHLREISAVLYHLLLPVRLLSVFVRVASQITRKDSLSRTSTPSRSNGNRYLENASRGFSWTYKSAVSIQSGWFSCLEINLKWRVTGMIICDPIRCLTTREENKATIDYVCLNIEFVQYPGSFETMCFLFLVLLLGLNEIRPVICTTVANEIDAPL